MSESTETESNAQIHINRESITLTLGDGTAKRIDLGDLAGDPANSIAWVQMMKLQEMSEYMKILAQQNVEMMKVQMATAEYMRRISEVASNPPKMPDPMEMFEKAMQGFGMDKSMIKKAFQSATAGVTVQPTGKD